MGAIERHAVHDDGRLAGATEIPNAIRRMDGHPLGRRTERQAHGAALLFE